MTPCQPLLSSTKLLPFQNSTQYTPLWPKDDFSSSWTFSHSILNTLWHILTLCRPVLYLPFQNSTRYDLIGPILTFPAPGPFAIASPMPYGPIDPLSTCDVIHDAFIFFKPHQILPSLGSCGPFQLLGFGHLFPFLTRCMMEPDNFTSSVKD